jgi:hypothetical protein
MAMMKYLLVLALTLSQIQADIVVVANKSFPLDSVETSTIKKLFLLQQKFVESSKIVPFNLSGRSELRQAFEKSVLQMDQSTLKSYWMERHYDGVRPPKQVSSVSAMKNYILKVGGAIGYLPKEEVSSEMKQLATFRN